MLKLYLSVSFRLSLCLSIFVSLCPFVSMTQHQNSRPKTHTLQVRSLSDTTTHCNTLQHTAPHQVKRLNQITPENVRNLRSMLKHVETKMVFSVKSWRKILQTDSITDHD